jgi:hypothetical protein
MRRSVADRRLRGGLPVARPLRSRCSEEPGASIRKRVPILGRCVRFFPFQEICGPRLDRLQGVERRRQFAPVTFITQERNSARDQASGVGVGTGSDCGEAFGARGRLCLGFVGSDAASSTTSDFDRERVVRLGLEVPSTSPSAASTFSSPFATADSAEIDAAAASAFGLRPRPSCFASDDRCSEYAGAVKG